MKNTLWKCGLFIRNQHLHKCLHILWPSGGNIYCLCDVVNFLVSTSSIVRNDWTSTGETDETWKVIVNYLNFLCVYARWPKLQNHLVSLFKLQLSNIFFKRPDEAEVQNLWGKFWYREPLCLLMEICLYYQSAHTSNTMPWAILHYVFRPSSGKNNNKMMTVANSRNMSMKID
jgi:hypothetical protein